MSISSNLNDTLFADVEMAQQGDKQAFSRLIQQTSRMVSSIALSIVKDLDSSEDVAQQVYIGAWQQLDSLQNSKSILPWLRQMTRYKALNFLRDNKVKQKLDSVQADLLLSQFCDPEETLDVALERDQQSAIVRDFIQQLPEESREIVLLYYREDQSSQQVARLLEQSEANIRQKLSRVRKLLQEQILSKHGRLLLSTAPTIGLSSLVLGALTTSSPVAAATLAGSAASGKSGFLAKFAALLGGSMFGALFGIIAIRLSTVLLLKKISREEAKQQVLHYRKHMTVWILFGGILLTLAYELTAGWWAPVCAYSLFAAGVIVLVRRMHRLIEIEVYSVPSLDPKELRSRKIQRFCGLWGMVLGMGTGFAGLLIGLVNSGRLPL
ncbi:RNA polymerase sigma factor [Flavobacterium sp. W21_SRS_FM6]|uniref:RNA polymerase sigma factor n=1 Tax=Flavobacterium sp. W21_SRS_FM6 TaxID=3240268 RepID=UPI003F909945